MNLCMDISVRSEILEYVVGVFMDSADKESITSLLTEFSLASLIRSLAVDSLSNIWIGTYGGGVYKLCETGWENYSVLDNKIYSIIIDRK